MISLISCSRSTAPNQELLANIEQTIGVPYELIFIDNSKNDYSIFSAYNYGASLAKFETICFMHDDIRYHSKNWGRVVIDVLANGDVGLVGIAGTSYLPEIPCPWWISNFKEFPFLKFNIVQHDRNGVKLRTSGNQDAKIKYDEVVVVDGVWFCCTKPVWNYNKFDEKLFKGFHFYDFDFSLGIRQKGLKVVVSYEVLIEHFSNGSMDLNWIKTARIFNRKWHKNLPQMISPLGKSKIREVKLEATYNYLDVLNFCKDNKLIYWLGYWIPYWIANMSKQNTYTLLKSQIKNYLK